MADRGGLKLVGFIFATVTLAVMLATGMVVKGYADGDYSLEGYRDRPPIVQDLLTIGARIAAVASAGISGSRSAPSPPRLRPAVRQSGS